MQIIHQILTYRPISGGKFRCNQTGEKVTKPKRHKLAYFTGIQKKSMGKRKVKNLKEKAREHQIQRGLSFAELFRMNYW